MNHGLLSQASWGIPFGLRPSLIADTLAFQSDPQNPRSLYGKPTDGTGPRPLATREVALKVRTVEELEWELEKKSISCKAREQKLFMGRIPQTSEVESSNWRPFDEPNEERIP